MHKRKRSLLCTVLVSLAAVLGGCSWFNSPPDAAFSAAPTSGDLPLTVAFDASATTDTGGSIVSYAWSFGDGTTGSGISTSHTYTLEGAFAAVLTVTDSYGGVGTSTQTIQVAGSTNASPAASFVATPMAGGVPLTVSFNAGASSDEDGTIESYEWAFGDGSTGTGVSVTHTYTAAGTYVALLTVTDDQGADGTTTLLITVNAPGNQPPVAVFTESAFPTFLLPVRVAFNATGSYDSDGSIVAYNWDFGDGQTGVGSTITHEYAAYASYTVILTVIDNDGAVGSVSRAVKVRYQPPGLI